MNQALEVFENADTGIASKVFAREDGRFTVTMVDTDEGVTLPQMKIFPALEQASAYAKKIAYA
jgi:hypothetical protein